MKPQILLTCFLLSILGVSLAQKPTLVLSFSANNIGQVVPLDSILIENLTQVGDTTLYAPDTLLMLDYITSQHENAISGEKELTVTQNYPNPMAEQTKVDVYLPESTTISVRINDPVGRILQARSYQLNHGFHTFSMQSGAESVYFLTIDAARQSKTIKLINAPNSGWNSGAVGLEYLGLSEYGKRNLKSVKVQGNFGFNLGDELKFTASTALGEMAITAIPEENQAFTFEYYVTGVPCPDMPTLTDIDGNVYNTVLIGNQCWMKENLKTTSYNNGTPIPNITEVSAWSALSSSAYVWYDNDISWKNIYGALYNWYTTVDGNGLCPAGWHVPTNDEWTVLTDYIGGIEAPHGNELKSCRQENSPLAGDCNTSEHPRWVYNPNNWGTDDYGFAILPGGYRSYNGAFIGMENNTYLWSSSDYQTTHAFGRSINSSGGGIGEYGGAKRHGFAIRCLRD